MQTVHYRRFLAHAPEVPASCPNGPAYVTWQAPTREDAEEQAADQSAWDYEFGIVARWDVEAALADA